MEFFFQQRQANFSVFAPKCHALRSVSEGYLSCKKRNFIKIIKMIRYLCLPWLCSKLCLVSEEAGTFALYHSDRSFSRILRFSLLAEKKCRNPQTNKRFLSRMCCKQEAKCKGEDRKHEHETRGQREVKMIYFTTYFYFPSTGTCPMHCTVLLFFSVINVYLAE